MKDRFFSIIAHDLNNPFNHIIGFSTMLIEHWINLHEDKKLRYINNINETSKNTHELLENLLLWARSQRNEINIQPVVIDIAKIIHENMAFFEKLASNKNITLIYDDSQSIYAIADYDMILKPIGKALNFIKNQDKERQEMQ
ncbi:MAG: HAMP domain-containing histidine kinase [Desulfobacterales bacterium]|nr:HAMP domain-containing histidine kinase [Desulfobacterales bacterium]